MLGFKWLKWLAGALMTGFSMAKIINAVLEHRFAEWAQSILDAWDQFLQVFALPIRDFLLNPIVVLVGRWLDVSLVLQPHWIHIFVLAILHTVNDAAQHYTISRNPRHELAGANIRFRNSAISRGIIGALIFLVVAVVVGSIPIANAQIGENFLIVAVPVYGFWAYLTFTGWWGAKYLLADLNTFHGRSRSRKEDQKIRWDDARVKGFNGLAMGSLLLLLAGIILPELNRGGRSGFVVLALLVALLAGSWVRQGMKQSKRQVDESLWSAYMRQGNFEMGLAMLRSFLIPILLIALA